MNLLRKFFPTEETLWSLDQRVLPVVKISANVVEIKNIRNFIYRSVTDYTPRYYDKTFFLSELTSLDYIVEPFGSFGAAHTFVSFGFKDGSYVSISTEIRKAEGRQFSQWKVFFKKYPLMYVIADEQDVVKLRSNYRKDQVYIYPVITTKVHIKELFIYLLNKTNTLHNKPEYYNPFSNNCVSNLAEYIHLVSDHKFSRDYRLLMTKHSDKLAQELGLIAPGLTIEEARSKYLINHKAQKYADSADFSRRIRE